MKVLRLYFYRYFVFNRLSWKILKQCLSDNQRAEITFSCSRLLTQRRFINYSYLLIISLQNIAFSFLLGIQIVAMAWLDNYQ